MHALIALISVKLGSRRSLSLTLVDRIPLTIPLQIKSSFSCPHLWVVANVFSSVTYWSVVSDGLWFLVGKRCPSTIIFFRGWQYSSNFWNSIFTVTISSPSSTSNSNMSFMSCPCRPIVHIKSTFLLSNRSPDFKIGFSIYCSIFQNLKNYSNLGNW